MKISHRIFVLIFCITILISFSNFFLTRYQGEVLHNSSEQLLAETLVQSLRTTLVQNVIDGNKLRVTNQLINILEQDNPIEFLYVTDKGQEVFAHSFIKGFPHFLNRKMELSVTKPGMHLINKYQLKQGLIFEYSEALIPGLDTTLHIGINQTYISQLLTKNTRFILLVSLISILVALIIVYFWSKRITRPLAQLAEQIKMFGLGEEINFSNLGKADPEIRELSKTLQIATSERMRAQLTVQEREQDLAITLNSIGDAVITTDAYGCVTRMNPVAERLTGWTLREAHGQEVKSIFPIINATTREPIENPVEKVLATGETVYLSNHTTLISKDGTEYHIADSAAPIRSGQGNIQGMVLIFNNVSEQYQLRQDIKNSQLLMQGLMDDLKSMVGIMQPDGYISFINQMPLELAGITRGMVIGKQLWTCDWFSSEQNNINEIERLCKEAAKGLAVSRDVRFKTKNKLVWIELGIYPVLDDDNQITQMIFEGVDISQRKESEELQKNYQIELEQKVHERTAELEAKAAELMRATQLKSEFLANMSHELRTPMNSIIGFTGRVIKKAADKLEERQLTNLKTVERNAHHLLGLINGLLDLSKIEAGKMEAYAEHFNFSTLVHEVFSLTQPMIEKKEIKLETQLPSEDIQLYTDNTKLKQVLINLVSNSIKFTKRGSITISAELQQDKSKNQSNIKICVIDTGVGMSEDALKYVFEAFRQVDGSLTRQAGGTGLGLAIVKNFTELLGGQVSVLSEQGKGTTFEIVIPVNLYGANTNSGVENKSAKLSTTANDRNKKTILCIDDEADVLELLGDYLADEGFNVVAARTAEEGLKLARKIKPFAITLDILMPQKDGWSVLSELKSSEDTLDIPVIIISFIENKALGYQLGAFDYMQKPVNPQRLHNIIHNLKEDSINFTLVVDDDPDARDLICQIMSDADIQCETAVNGRKALSVLEQADEQLPDLILLDLMMPEMDGFEFLQIMQKNPKWQNIPVVIVTAKTLVEHDIEFLRPRVKSILQKEGLTESKVLKQLSLVINKFVSPKRTH